MKKWIVLTLLLLTELASAAIEMGKDYDLLAKPQPMANPKKIEVIEFFQYACIHCSSLEPVLSGWASRRPADVDFKRVHVVWQKSMEGAARFYATELITHTSSKLHRLTFEAVLQKRMNLGDESNVSAWLKTVPGIDVALFMQTYKSFGVNAEVARASQMTRDYSVTGTPMIIIAGKYVLHPAMPERVVEVMNEVIDKVRKEQNKN